MNKVRKILFTIGLVAILVAISITCLIVGRGHTVYIDNKKTDNYDAYEYIEVFYKGEKVTTLAKNERTVVSCIGQNLDLDLIVTKKRNSMDEEIKVSIKLPYSLDNITLSLNTYLENPEDPDCLTEFVSLIDMAQADEEIDLSGDDMGMSEE